MTVFGLCARVNRDRTPQHHTTKRTKPLFRHIVPPAANGHFDWLNSHRSLSTTRCASRITMLALRDQITLLFVLCGLAILGPASAQTCSQYGNATSNGCLCPPGFNPASGGNGTCSLPVCGGSLYQPGQAAPSGSNGLGDVGDCGCTSGWTGPGCTGTFPFTFTGIQDGADEQYARHLMHVRYPSANT